MQSESNLLLRNQLKAKLQLLESQNQRRSLTEVQGINLCSNDYLGLAESAALKEAVLEAVRLAPRVGGTGSRLLSGHSIIWNDLEQEFAAFAGTESALYFGSGYAANIGLLSSLAEKEDVIFSDALNHASLIDGIRLSGATKAIYPHRDLDALEKMLRQHAYKKCRKLIVTETIFSMNGDIAPLKAICALAEKHGAGVICDEAHATAVYGPSGSGVAAQLGLVSSLVAAVHTCGKALASIGAFVCGSKILKDFLINHARTFIFSTALPAYMADQIRAALRLSLGMSEQRGELSTRSAAFCKALLAQGFDTAKSATQIVPAIIGENADAVDAASFLQEQGFAVKAIRPPTVEVGTARLRFSLTTLIPNEELLRLEKALAAWRAQHNFAGSPVRV